MFAGFFVLFLVQLWYTCPKVENAKNAAVPEALLLLCNLALPLPVARDFRLRKKPRMDIALEKEETLA